jgi:DNA-directed RNA polymerase subunit RPC12/RpoP
LTIPIKIEIILPMQTSLVSGSRSDTLGRCHVCGAKVVVKSASEVVIKNAILKVDGASGRVTAKCSHCKAWVAVPLTYTG